MGKAAVKRPGTDFVTAVTTVAAAPASGGERRHQSAVIDGARSGVDGAGRYRQVDDYFVTICPSPTSTRQGVLKASMSPS